MPHDACVFTGWFGPTDHEWFRFLRARRDLDEVNFWSPSPKLPFKSLQPGTPFFFKLKAPYNAIGGFGYLAHSSSLPLRLAWDTFGEKNGAGSLQSLAQRIARYRGDLGPISGLLHEEIGCLMVSEPVFFDDQELIPQPTDWPAQAVRGKRISLDHGEGLRVWTECQLRVAARSGSDRAMERTIPAPLDRFGQPILVRPRLGQGTFRAAVLDAYQRQCAVTTEHSLPVLEAAHIRPYAEGGAHELSNGLVLRADLHRLFDDGWVGVDPRGRFHVSPRLHKEWANGRIYYDMQDREIFLPREEDSRPDPKVLEWHMDTRFIR